MTARDREEYNRNGAQLGRQLAHPGGQIDGWQIIARHYMVHVAREDYKREIVYVMSREQSQLISNVQKEAYSLIMHHFMWSQSIEMRTMEILNF